MKFIITDKDITKLEVAIESPFEMRALYILLKLTEQPAFQTVVCTVADFDSISGLGAYCKEFTRENPIKLVYNMLVNKGGYFYSLKQKYAIIDACKKALLNFNVEYQKFANSDYFKEFDKMRHALRLFRDIADGGAQLTMDQFQNSIYAQSCVSEPGEMNRAYAGIGEFDKIIKMSTVVHTHYATNSITSHDIFKNISDQIKDDAILARKSDASNTVGIQYHYYNYTVKPPIVAGIIAIFIGVFIAVCKTAYDTLLRERLEGDSKLSHTIIDNTITVLTGLLLLLINNRVNYYKKKFDDDRLEAAVLQLGGNVPAYKELLFQTGSKYQQSQIIHISSQDPEAAPLLGVITRTVNNFRFRR